MNINDTLESLRQSYRMAALDSSDCLQDPELQFNKWFHEAMSAKCDEPNAFVLSTIAGNRPRARVVLLKGIHDGQFIFYTNYKSSKGYEIENNSHVSMTFLWLPLQRQIRIEGIVAKVDAGLSDDYFNKRPRGSQIGAIASPQSQKVSTRDKLEELFSKVEKDNEGNTSLKRPDGWGGFGITPDYVEFWQGRDNRMHDRMIYEKSSQGWELSRLAP